ncbi:hypothetical protein PILCRDRAFT_649870 [Piloderma croceum F 1598]|uniref:Uncharacterized protein n=1 Tax=Piloderma croceum (strain F 1598) TaxID=765440 RepID=A0A0C3BFY2_PILCF|nr:hypothetical protein PILCRDRAFT_649870 [Piloderma croceum F 1598]
MFHIPVQHTPCLTWISQSDCEHTSALPLKLRLHPWSSGFSLTHRLIEALRARRYDTMDANPVRIRSVAVKYLDPVVQLAKT